MAALETVAPPVDTSAADRVTPDTTERAAGRARAPMVALLAGNAVSLIGNELSALAIPWFVLQTTGSAGKTGLVAAFTLLPTVIAMVFGGALSDRFGHRRMSVFSDLLSAGTVAAVPLLYHTVGLPFAALLVLVFLGALFDAPGSTARGSLIPEAATLARLPLERVNGGFQAIQSLAGLVGPLLAGGLIATLGPSNVLWLDAASFLVSAAAIGSLVPEVRVEPAVRGRYLDEVKEGWAFLVHDPLLRTIAGIATVINFLAAPLFAVLLPVLADREYGSANALGVAVAAVSGGTLVGALLYGAVGASLPRRPVLIGAFAVAWAPLIVVAAAPSLWLTALAAALCGLGIGPINPIVLTAMYERVPVALRGRLLGALNATAMLASPAGVLLAGGLVELVGVQSVIVAIAIWLTLLTVPLLLARSLHALDDRAGAPVADATGPA
jgi:MFS family permease